MDNEQKEEAVETEVAEENAVETADSTVKITDEEKLARLEGGAKRLRKKLGLDGPTKEEVRKVENKKSDDKLLERLDKMALQVAGITEADEVELFNNWKEQTGREADQIVGNSIFKKEIEDLRTAKGNLKATSDITGESGDKTGGAKSTPEYWIAKATKGKDGNLEFPEETPKELFEKIVEKISENEPKQSKKLKFYNE